MYFCRYFGYAAIFSIRYPVSGRILSTGKWNPVFGRIPDSKKGWIIRTNIRYRYILTSHTFFVSWGCPCKGPRFYSVPVQCINLSTYLVIFNIWADSDYFTDPDECVVGIAYQYPYDVYVFVALNRKRINLRVVPPFFYGTWIWAHCVWSGRWIV
jgi:hypothetical protein